MSCRNCSLVALSALGLSLLSLAAPAQSVIDTFDYNIYGYSPIAYLEFGVDDVAFGQTLRLPSGASRLDAFSFVIWNSHSDFPGQGNLKFGFQNIISEWDPVASSPVGSHLFTSGTLYADRKQLDQFFVQRFIIPTGGVTLDANKQYVSLLVPVEGTTPGFGNPGSAGDRYAVGATPNDTRDAYPSGVMVLKTPPPYNSWIELGGGDPRHTSDMTFRASFNLPYYANVAQGKPVTLNGSFTSTPSLAAIITDGTYLPAGTPRQAGTVQWDDVTSDIVIELGGLYSINALNLQADANDMYRVQYRRSANDIWRTVWTVDNIGDGYDGMEVRPDPAHNGGRYFLDNPVLATAFRIRGYTYFSASVPFNSDGHYGISEFQAYGVAVPEPGGIAFLLTGSFAGGSLLLRRRRR